ncbi:hypothetical protein Tco_0767422 [Tanacetum coccineum]
MVFTCHVLGMKKWLVQEGTALGKDKSNPFLAVMTCQKSYSFSTYYDSCSESGKWFQSSMDLTLSGCQGLSSPQANGYVASSNPFTFYDSPLPGVNTPWDVMRIVCNPELMDVAEVVQIPTGRYVVPTGRVIATVSIKVPTGRTN